ncbi:MAG: rod-binding protein [Syntrophobacteraceae bacterium]|jgi:Rod binding domain-containing protein
MDTNVKPVLQVDSSRELESQKRRLRENCRAFESVMISYMMKTMRDGLIRGEEPGSTKELYEDMLADQVSKQIGSSSALGLGDMLYSKLEPLIKAKTSQEAKIPPGEAQTDISTTLPNKPGAG